MCIFILYIVCTYNYKHYACICITVICLFISDALVYNETYRWKQMCTIYFKQLVLLDVLDPNK